jgi:two-component system, NtrC family, response regulator
VTRSRPAILLVEDDPGLQKQMQWSLSDYHVLPANDRASALTIFRRETPRVVILDLGLPPLPDEATEGLALLEAVLTQQPATKIIVASGNQDRRNAVKAIGLGAYDFFPKPIDPDVLLLIIGRAFHLLELEDENRKLQRTAHSSPFDGVIASSPQMLEVCRLVERVAPSNVSVLLLGESGTGKELLARALHSLNLRSAKKFVAINCSAIPETLLESELFGYERGAFTGASKQTPGTIEHAHGGTLFLDEIGDMPLSLQAKLLRFLQERTIVRLGGRESIDVDTRVVSATNRDLQQAIGQGQFREDLYYRLSEISIEIPPLREREGDAVLIAKATLERLRQPGVQGKMLSEDAVRAVSSYAWPGNVRELESCIKRAMILTEGQFLTKAALGLSSSGERQSFPTLRQARAKVEINIIRRALALSNNNVSEAAKLLGVSRPTLYDLMETYDLNLERATAVGAHRQDRAVREK